MLRLIFIIFFLVGFLYSNEKITLQLKWFHQFQFAGYYAAKEKGFYSEVGLDVDIKQRDLKHNNIEQVIKNEAQYGVADSILFLYKSKNEPVFLVAPIFQHSPNVLITLKNSKLNSIYDFDKKNMIFYENDTDGFSILAMLKKFNVKPNLIRKREANDYLKLINNEVDISPAYLSNEPFYFKERNIDINIINPTNYGFDLYGDMLFTNQNEVINHPDRVNRFKEATLRGWEYALDHKEEIIQLIHKKYNSSKSLEHLRYEAKIVNNMIDRDSYPIGLIDRGRVQYINNLYKEYGLTEHTFNVKDFVFEDYNEKYIDLSFTDEEKDFLKNNPTLTVQSLDDFPPFNFKEKGEFKGYSIDYFKLIGKYLGVNIKFETALWNEHLEDMKSGKLHIMPHVAISNARKEYIEYTDIKDIDYIPTLVVRKDLNINSFEDLKGKKVAMLRKSYLEGIFKKYYSSIDLVLVDSISEAISDVSNGKIDAAFGGLTLIQYLIKKNWFVNLKTININDMKYLEKIGLYVGVSKKNSILKSILEKVENSIPVYEKIKLKSKWIDVKSEELKKFIINQEEISFLKTKKEFNMCINPNFMPIEGIKNGNYIGISSEYIDLFKSEVPIEINLKRTTSWKETLDLIKQGKCEIMPVFFDSKEYSEYFNFTDRYLDFPLVIATKTDKPFINDISTLDKQKIGLLKNSFYKKYLKEKYPNIDIVEIDNIQEGLSKVDNNKLYAVIDSLPIIGYEIQKNYIGNLKITGKVEGDWGLSFATTVKEPLLNVIFNKLIKNLSNEQKNEISKKWLSVKYQQNIDYQKILWIVLFFTFIIVIIVYKNKKIREVNEKMQKNLDLINENVIISKTDKNGIITEVSKAFCNISGYSKEELIGQSHNIVRHEDVPEQVYKELWQTIKKGKTWKGEIKNKNKDGHTYWVSTTITPQFDKNGNIIGYSSIKSNITDKKRIEYLSITDELTTLYNKRYFNIMFDKEINRIKRSNQIFAFVIFDVDHFKQYNDNYGHQKGDEVLISIGKKINSLCKRSSDIPFRIGGEEFAIIFQANTNEGALTFAEMIRKEIEMLNIEHRYNSASSSITISVGLYTAKADEIKTSKELYKITDDKLYKAKEKGRNRVEY
ncbi:ABC transporter substrate-binding protein [Halarcobacter sp.]|uniref:ABC transporter substrate-binding protein n=1 Tax=Halarcobacter sp. TaxID=2321133 RepID=UPI0029F47CF5|nr:transporter substrate-binding domain-containing protein [Halarcobacter sp.]